MFAVTFKFEWAITANIKTNAMTFMFERVRFKENIKDVIRGSLQGRGTSDESCGFLYTPDGTGWSGSMVRGTVVGGPRLGQRLGEWSGVSESEAEAWSLESGW